MAVQEQTPLQEYTANGITKQFDLEFDCESADHLIVSIDDLEVLHTDWYLSGNAIMFHIAPANGKQVKIQRNTPFNRLADYQSYNNSFRPPAINKDFDRIWWKLQELGVADWILSNRINALKAYVDDRDDELRAYLMEEIRKQGVALDQLDEYYNYLMERLAQIAVDKGWDASFVVDGDKNQKQINAARFEAVDSVADLAGFKPKSNGQVIYLKSYHIGKATGWGYLVCDQNDASIADNVNTFSAFGGGLWKRQREKDGVVYAVDAGVIAGEGIDNTEAFTRLSATLIRGDVVVLPYGLIETTDFKMSQVGIVLQGKARTSTTLKLTTASSCIRTHEACQIKDMSVIGVGINDHPYLIKDDRPYNTADVDLEISGCYLGHAERGVYLNGRGLTVNKTTVYLRISIANVNFPDPFTAGPNDNQTLEEGFRHFVFTNNRTHYSHTYFFENNGYNKENLRGVLIANNEMEGRARYFDGYVRDALITGNQGYWYDTPNDLFILRGGENINFIGNNHSGVYKNGVIKKDWLGNIFNIIGNVKGLHIKNNSFVALKGDVVQMNAGASVDNLTLSKNNYLYCFTNTTRLLTINAGSLSNLNIDENPVTAPSTSWAPVRRANVNLGVSKISVNMTVLGSSYVHNLPTYDALRSPKKHGFYTGNGTTQNIANGYFPKLIKISRVDGSYNATGSQDYPISGVTLTYDYFTVTGAVNTNGVSYYWETE